MARRLSKRQRARIQTLQEGRRQRLEDAAGQPPEEPGDGPSPQDGLVVVRHGATLVVEDLQGRFWHCLARQHIGDPVCGDRVVWQASGADRGVVTALLERRTLLSRPDYRGREKPLAANLSQFVILLAPHPEPSEYLLDQYLVAAEGMGVAPLIVCNKMDLLDRSAREALRDRLARYQVLGYPLLWLSLARGDGIAPLAERLARETSILVGQSGVGKSSLVQALLPDREIQIGRLSQASGLGRHTTSAATCYGLPGGGYLIDSPGVRSFRLSALAEPLELARDFREIFPLIGHCRFANCHHQGEPGCALEEEVREGRLHPQRLAHFCHMAARLEQARRRGRTA